MIVTIDGPAGAGKSTVARRLAAKLGIAYLDTGAMYRAVAQAALERGVDLTDEAGVFDVAKSIDLELDCGPTHTRVRVDGRDISEAIRTVEVTAATVHVARNQRVRDLMVESQREHGRSLGTFVAEGRDQGSIVFPGADVKFVLEASIKKRAQRRHRELGAGDEVAGLESVERGMKARDSADLRQWEPLLAPGAAIIIDTTDLTIEQVVDRMAELISKT